MALKPVISREDDGECVYFTVRWSRLILADKYGIITTVPSVAGIYELYSMDEKKKLNLFHVASVWFGGLRHELRVRTDPELEQDLARRRILEDRDCYYRYSLIENSDDMADILFFFNRTYFPHTEPRFKPSGRYTQIHVKELSDDKIVTI
jgi:hypothetical protein